MCEAHFCFIACVWGLENMAVCYYNKNSKFITSTEQTEKFCEMKGREK